MPDITFEHVLAIGAIVGSIVGSLIGHYRFRK